MNRAFKLALGIGTGLALTGAGVYGYRRSQNARVSASEFNASAMPQVNSLLQGSDDEPMNLHWPRVPHALDRQEALNEMDIRVYVFHHCPFCSKLEMFLTANNIKYKRIYVNRITKEELKNHEYKKVPQLQFGENGPILGDATEIVSTLATHLGQDVKSPEVTRWRKWSSDVLARYVVLEVNDDWKENAKFLYETPNLTLPERVFFVLMSPMLGLFIHPMTKKNLVKLGKDPENPRENLHEELKGWVTTGLKGQEYHGGSEPDVCDTDVYGVLYGVGRHPMYTRAAESDASLHAWMKRMEAHRPAEAREIDDDTPKSLDE